MKAGKARRWWSCGSKALAWNLCIGDNFLTILSSSSRMIDCNTQLRRTRMRKLCLTLMLTIAAAVAVAEPHSIYDFTMKSIDGQQVSLKNYSGKVVLLVNVASRCGFTPQYAGLEAVYEKYKDRGLVIVGIPANNFAQQEPGTNERSRSSAAPSTTCRFP